MKLSLPEHLDKFCAYKKSIHNKMKLKLRDMRLDG